VGNGAALEYTHSTRPTAFEKLEAQPAFAGARFGDHADHLAVARGGLFERIFQRAQIGDAADEARQPAGTRDVEAIARGADADERWT
jgi:hypothetical protein